MLMRVQDELAEHQCPSPQPLEGVVPEYDAYEYFQDVEYLSDGGYGDELIKHKKVKSQMGSSTAVDLKKRKRVATSNEEVTSRKRRKLIKQDADSTVKRQGDNGNDIAVIWLSKRERSALLGDTPLLPQQSAKAIVQGDPDSQFTQERRNLVPQQQTMTASSSERQPSPSSSRSDSAIAGDGFDLGDIASIAGLLSAEHIDSLKAILTAQGLNADALDVVLKDLLEGRDRAQEDEDEEVEG
jgi:hypothetical protein